MSGGRDMVILEERKISGEQLQNFHSRDVILHRMVKHGNQKSSETGGKEKREETDAGAYTGFVDSVESSAFEINLGFDQTEEKIALRVWWLSIRKHVIAANAERPVFKKNQNSLTLSKYNIPMVPNWSQHLLTCMVVAVDYFSKWTEAEPLHRKPAEELQTVCIIAFVAMDISISINDIGHELVNSISTEVQRLPESYKALLPLS
ncbi:hypothetical protein PoB_004345100 [Plakobranchus ocellatus]|uniref:B-like cyclin n=1 Tax=Plakobranchus ocellatus TaxID=259542 RepID=A0AAV4B0N0_9GAST|nr:hypothetical protein PoB_004345100 [Plakobranchus ocellatus]